jgi:hypothetical protein
MTNDQFQEISTGQSKEMPAKIVVYGRSKIGKTRFACSFPDAFLIDIENGSKYLDKSVRATPHLRTYDEVLGWLKHIYNDEKFMCGWLIVDSLDWLEELAQARLIKMHGAKSITDPSVKDFAYHKGVADAAKDVITILRLIDAINRKKQIKSIVIAHSVVKDIDLPNRDPFARYTLKLSKQLAGKTMEWCDMLLFADHDFHVSSDGKTSEPKPMLFTGGDASYEGGGRIKLPKSIPISYEALEKAIFGEKS